MRTPGKWEVIAVDESEMIGVLPKLTFTEECTPGAGSAKNGGWDIAQCYGPDRFYNAALCAAAPDLAAAIDAILRHGLTKTTRLKAREAIKKARGKVGAGDTADKGHNVKVTGTAAALSPQGPRGPQG